MKNSLISACENTSIMCPVALKVIFYPLYSLDDTIRGIFPDLRIGRVSLSEIIAAFCNLKVRDENSKKKKLN